MSNQRQIDQLLEKMLKEDQQTEEKETEKAKAIHHKQTHQSKIDELLKNIK